MQSKRPLDPRSQPAQTGDSGFERGIHAAIIMDGNGRWATARGLPRTAGHRAGAKAVRKTVESAPSVGIDALTLYAFSSDNWNRPREEVAALMTLLRRYLRQERERAIDEGVRFRMIGRRDRLDPSLVREVAETEAATANGHALDLRIAVDYSARDTLVRAAVLAAREGVPSRDRFARHLAAAGGDPGSARDVDLLIRTGGEHRLSDFLLWECAYAELLFTPVMWPDFTGDHLEAAVEEFRSRNRRFGRIPEERTARSASA
jgi:undecaprenyl diphosphate synthase